MRTTTLRRSAPKSVLIAALAATFGCYAPPGQTAPRAAPVRLVVHNHGVFDVNVYAIQGSGSTGMRLGTASSFSTTVLVVSRTASTRVACSRCDCVRSGPRARG